MKSGTGTLFITVKDGKPSIGFHRILDAINAGVDVALHYEGDFGTYILHNKVIRQHEDMETGRSFKAVTFYYAGTSLLMDNAITGYVAITENDEVIEREI